ncbi:MAG TPA: hypothetical protein VJB18_03915, partial [Burkholderiales bacterium]|nr:hypothetical protein [Burkholderiales bacterium]
TPAHPGSGTSNAAVPLESVVESLEELVAKDLADDDRMSNDTPKQIALEPESPATSPAKKPDSAQQAFGFDSMDGGGTTSGTKEVERRREQPPRAASGDGRDAGGRATPGAVAGTAADDDWDVPPTALATDVAASPPVENATDTMDATDFNIEAPAAEAEPSLDLDIPILTEPVSAERFADNDIPVLEDIATADEMSTAHEIAERVVARLNAERQVRGEPALDAGVLEALRALLREELERNSPE